MIARFAKGTAHPVLHCQMSRIHTPQIAGHLPDSQQNAPFIERLPSGPVEAITNSAAIRAGKPGSGNSIRSNAQFRNKKRGTVSRQGCLLHCGSPECTLPREPLFSRIKMSEDSISVVDRSKLDTLSRRLKAQGKIIVTTNGCFDLLHVGHVRILKAAKSLGDILIVGINSDDSVRQLKGPARPITEENDRAEILMSLSCVDYVTIFSEDTPVEFLREVKPDIHVKGSDYSPDTLAETPVVENNGGKIVILELVPERSTSSIVSRIQDERSG